MSLEYAKITPSANFIGRSYELSRLDMILSEEQTSITVLHGRRRVGKSELLEQALQNRKVLKFEGIEGRPVTYQRESFLGELAKYCSDFNIAKLKLKSWKEVFLILAEKLEKTKGVVVYLEELQWLANYRSDLVSDLKYVWDNHLRKVSGLKLILCGSATSFMVGKVLKSKALYSRSINEIHLEPFSLAESRKYLANYSNSGSLDAHLLIGGIPEYLRYFKKNETALMTLQNEVFVPGAYFLSEFDRVFTSSLAKFETHKQLVLLFAKRKFYLRSELAEELAVSGGGSFTGILEDLELIGLIARFNPYKSKKTFYYLRDPYLNFYLKFILPKRVNIKEGQYKRSLGDAIDLVKLQQYLGYSFERYCREKHFTLAKILGISGVEYKHGPYSEISSAEGGFQFDMVFDRKDRCLSLFEIKCKQTPLTLDVASEFEVKMKKINIPRSYNVQKVLVSAGPISKTLSESRYFNRIIELDELVENDE